MVTGWRTRLSGGTAAAASRFAPRHLWQPLAVLCAIWLGTGFYTVGSNERGIVLTFGQVTGRTGPGLHWAWPRPIGRAYTPATTEVRRMEVGFTFLGRLVDAAADARRSDMMTGDENILKLMLVVQYRLRDPVEYLFGTEGPDWLVERSVESALSAALAWRRVDDVLTSSKAAIQVEAIAEAQRRLDAYGAGVTLLGGNLQVVSPPVPVIAAFNDVTAAKKDSEGLVENARLYANQTVPGARGEAEEIVNRARGQAQLRVEQARGESQAFEAMLAEYRRDPRVTRRRLYLESMERVFARTRTVVVRDGSRVTILDGER